jgi:hypothetical protein
MLPVLILGFTLNYWITTSLADWLSYLLTDERVRAAMQAGSRSVTFVTILAAMASTLLALLPFIFRRQIFNMSRMSWKKLLKQIEMRSA